MAERVVEQDAQDLADESGGRHHGAGWPGGHHDLASLRGEPLLPVGDLIVDERGHIDLGASRGAARRATVSSSSNVELSSWIWADAARCFGHTSVVAALEHLEPHRDAGQPGAQLVGRVGGEPALGLQHAVDPVGAQPQ